MLNIYSGLRFLACGSVFGLALAAIADPAGITAPHQLNAKNPSYRQRLQRHESRFYANKGQWNHKGQYLTRTPGLDVWFEDRGIDFDYYQTGGTKNHPNRKGQAVSMQFVGGKSAIKFDGVAQTAAVTDYYIGKKAVRGVHGYMEVRAKDVFPGVDFRGYYDGNRPRYDFIVAKNAKADQIRLKYKGANKVALTKDGITFDTQIGQRVQGDLHAYQTIAGKRIDVPSKFRLLSKNEVGLTVGKYDHSKPLVIDPLVYGTYFGGDGGWDEVRSVVADTANNGGVYLTGDTQSSLFPVNAGPYFFNLQGQQNAFIAKLQGDAFNEDYAAFVGGTVFDTGQFLKIDPHGNVLMAGTTFSSDFPGNTRPNRVLLTGDASATGGQFVLTNGFAESAPLSFNATLAQVTAAIKQIGLGGALDPKNPPSNPTGIPLNFGGSYEFNFLPDAAPGEPFSVINQRIGSSTGEFSSGLPFIIVDYFAGQNPVIQKLTPEGSNCLEIFSAFQASFSTGSGNNLNTQTTPAIPMNMATTSVIQAALQGLSNIGQLKVVVTDLGPGRTSAPSDQTLSTDIFQVEFQDSKGVDQAVSPLNINETALQPQPSYTVQLFPYAFSLAFQPVANGLVPIQNSELSFGNEFGTELNGFDVKPVANPAANLADDIVFSGNTSFKINEFPGLAYDARSDGSEKGFMVRMSFSPFGGSGANYALQSNASQYLTGQVSTNNRGVALDASGSAYVVGTVFNRGNVDTSVNPVFVTTKGVFGGVGQLLKNDDIYVRKYAPNSDTIVWSGLLGGHSNDVAGGFFVDVDGSDVATGSAIALDAAGGVYVTGVSTSFDFPRTRGVYGEDFTDAQAVTVTKISNDGFNIVYSTNLNSNGDFVPAGIAVNAFNDAVVTGNDQPIETFPFDLGQTPPVPNQPTNNNYGGIGTTPDAFVAGPTGPTAPQIGVTNSWVNILNSDATALVFGSFLGGPLDNRVYGPYVDAFGDTWLYGWVETFRAYVVGTTVYVNFADLPQSMLSRNAFKNYGDNGNSTNSIIPFGVWDPFSFEGAQFIDAQTLRDGWVLKLRVGLPNVSGLAFSPATIPGGFGSSSTGTVTLSQPAPASGAVINLTIQNNNSASFSSTSQVGTSSITIPGGATTGSFTVFSNPVSSVTPVSIEANYLGSFQVAALNVEPYIAGFSLAPTSVVGGNTTAATVTLIQPAPAGGLPVTFTSTSSNVSFPSGNTLIVPAGQTTATLTIQTAGVIKPLQDLITVGVGSYTTTQTLNVTPATLATLTFNPVTIADGTTTTGTITMNGYAGANLVVTLAPPSGGSFPNGVTVSPGTVTIPKGPGPNGGPSQATFTVKVPATSVDPLSNVTIQANMSSRQAGITTYPASSVSGSFNVVANSITSFQLSGTSVTAGGTLTGTITIAKPAPPSGLNLTVSAAPAGLLTFSTGTNNPTATLVLNIPSGATSASFNVFGGFSIKNIPVVISVTKAGQTLSKTVTLVAPTLSLTINPQELIGGTSGTATLTLPVNTPKALTFVLTSTVSPSSSPTAILPSTVTIPANSSTVTFPVRTSGTPVQSTITITATDGSYSASAQLVVDSVGIASISFAPSNVLGGQSVECTVTLQGPAPAGGLSINLSTASGNYLKLPTAAIVIPAGQTTVSFPIPSGRVSRDVDETVTATTADGSSSASATVTIMR